jgi:cold-inducible RNA-binding protein
MKMYVGNLAWSVTTPDLETLFGTYGPVRSVEVIMDRETGRSRGFAFVEMEGQDAAEQAMQALNGSPFQGRNLTVNEARERTPRAGGGGGGGRGGYGGGGGGGGQGGGRSRDY